MWASKIRIRGEVWFTPLKLRVLESMVCQKDEPAVNALNFPAKPIKGSV